MKKRAALWTTLLLLVLLSSCGDRESEREVLRGKLDTECEEKTEELSERAALLRQELTKLMTEHRVLDEKHAVLDVGLEGKKMSAEDKAVQQGHLQAERYHEKTIKVAEDMLNRFEACKRAHEEAEETHGTIPLDEVRKEHEQFESDLEDFQVEFDSMIRIVGEANEQMAIIFKEHEALSAKYK